MTRSYTIAPAAQADIIGILVVSYDHFGSTVRDGYEQLIAAAIDDIVGDRIRVGVQDRPDLGPGIRSRHVRLSRDNVPADVRRIIRPRHIVFFREFDGEVHILRVLHEVMDLVRQRYE
ncbi:MAG TPA: type II toxin-antitoxin system RelE/ParE family toxin [Microbacterium sp.]|nr:type II toxin-antitoxin system RelE/ParE family toxin [Microbacterium sp.]